MPIPLATTTIAVSGVRPESDQDADGAGYPGYVEPVPAVLASGVRACISTLSMDRAKRRYGVDGQQSSMRLLLCDPVELTQFDRVQDESTGEWFDVHYVDTNPVTMFGLDHVVALLRIERGI